jgi:hypothetical protein
MIGTVLIPESGYLPTWLGILVATRKEHLAGGQVIAGFPEA